MVDGWSGDPLSVQSLRLYSFGAYKARIIDARLAAAGGPQRRPPQRGLGSIKPGAPRRAATKPGAAPDGNVFDSGDAYRYGEATATWLRNRVGVDVPRPIPAALD